MSVYWFPKIKGLALDSNLKIHSFQFSYHHYLVFLLIPPAAIAAEIINNTLAAIFSLDIAGSPIPMFIILSLIPYSNAGMKLPSVNKSSAWTKNISW